MEWQGARRERCGKLRRTRAWVDVDGSTFESDCILLPWKPHEFPTTPLAPERRPFPLPWIRHGTSFTERGRLPFRTHLRTYACSCVHMCARVLVGCVLFLPSTTKTSSSTTKVHLPEGASAPSPASHEVRPSGGPRGVCLLREGVWLPSWRVDAIARIVTRHPSP